MNKEFVNRELVEHLLSYDVIKEAEKYLKGKYDTDPLVQRLVASNTLVRTRKLTKVLQSYGDSYRSMRYLDFLNVIMETGFKPVFQESFTGAERTTEMFIVFWNETKGILMSTESYGGTIINMAVIQYNWIPNQKNKDWEKASTSGLFSKVDPAVWLGIHTVTEALKYKVDLLDRRGELLPQWVERAPLVLLNYREEKMDKKLHKELVQRKLDKFPEAVRKAILA